MTVTEQEIHDYVARVRGALADLPPSVRDELTEDLSEHLAVVAAESGGSLVERLGAPEAYAVELRVAAGVDAGRGAAAHRLTAYISRARARLSTLDRQLGAPLGYPTVRAFLHLLAPGWWILRGYLAAMLLTVISTGSDIGVLPRFAGSLQLGLMTLAALVVASVMLGRRQARLWNWPRGLLVLGNLVLVGFGLMGLINLEIGRGDGDFYAPISVDSEYAHISDVFVYDSEGRLVEYARLFDQNGDPIRLGYPECPDLQNLNGNANPLLRGYPYCPDAAPFGPRPTSDASPPTLPAPPGTVQQESAAPPTTPENSPTTPENSPATPENHPTTAEPALSSAPTPSVAPTG
ncbi:HAAS signaling domain-containing protein [Salinispora tropica]|uniref:Uncharacterized protein n=1 Tax=Salinispora tropica (strain ATCC BAA-916 / DSM 44818 / JCM 13857 / NBRC 105044 / CNB-440) TaxID=369723 RepID=A4X3C3_SALTO|nr:hypothetical protein [Salinispora tropica]ABP53373.1 hypothetical protein Strop_0896 [Salinispora tropica CNB-440]